MARRGSKMMKSCGCCKKYMDHLGGKMNCFLRRMTATNKHSMIMPNRFLNHFRGKISGTITLESPNGNLYDVEVTKCMNKTVLRYGWEAFVVSHYIQENDSVLFRQIEGSHFEVLILDSDDCEKVISCPGIKNTSCLEERRVDYIDNSSSSCDDTTKSFGSKRFAGRRTSSSRCRGTEKMVVKFCSSEESGEDSPSEDESFESDDLQPPPRPAYVLSRGSYLSDAEKDKVIALIQEVQPEVTVFVAIMRRCNVQPSAPYVVISKDYAVAHFPHGSAIVILQRPDKGKKWHPNFYKRKDKTMHMLKGQWLDFVRDNRLQEGDICLFVPTKGGRRFTFTVHALHTSAAAHSRAGAGVQRDGSSHCKTTTKKASALHIKEEQTDGEDNSSSESNRHGVPLKSLESKDIDGPPEPSYILPGRCSLSQSQNKIVEEKVRAIQSETPIYVAIMNNGHEHALQFGARYADVHLPDRKQTVVLHCKGKIWTITMIIGSRNRRVLGGGWSKFVHDNRLRVGDICLFELNKNKKKLTMTIHIIFQGASLIRR